MYIHSPLPYAFLEVDQSVLSCGAQDCRFNNTKKSQRTLHIIYMQSRFTVIFFDVVSVFLSHLKGCCRMLKEYFSHHSRSCVFIICR